MQSLYEAILQTNLINFLIVIGTLVLIFKKCRLGDLIEKMALETKAQVEKSALDTKTALSEYKAIKKSTKDTPLLQGEIINNATKSAQAIKSDFENNTIKKEQELEQKFEKSKTDLIESYKKKTTEEIYNTCLELAKNTVLERLNPETHKQLINSSIDELETIESELL